MRLSHLFLFAFLMPCLVQAQDFPRAKNDLSAVNLNVGGSTKTIDVSNAFAIDNVNGPLVEMTLNTGDVFYLEMYPDIAPVTVANFQAYLRDGSYTKTFIHRAESGFVIQGGGYFYATRDHVPTPRPPIANEFKLANLTGTVAMAKIDGDLNSATSEWFVNLVDNPSLDDVVRNGYLQRFAVFGRMIGAGPTTATDIGNLPLRDLNEDNNPTGPFAKVPYVTDNSVTPPVDYLVTLEKVEEIPRVGTATTGSAYLTLSVTSSNPSIVAASTSLSNVVLTSGSTVGTAKITVRATDPYSRWIETSFTARTVKAQLPLVSIQAPVATVYENKTTKGRYRIFRTGSTAKSLAVKLSPAGSTARNGNDLFSIPATVFIPAKKAYLDVFLTPKQDKLKEGTEFFTETIVPTTTYSVAPANSASIAIIDDDVPTVTMTAVDSTLGEDTTNTGNLHLTRTGATTAALPISVSVSGSADYQADYTVSPTDLTIPAGQASLNVTLTAVSDHIKEGTESIVVKAAPSAAYNFPRSGVTFSLLDPP